MIRSVSPRAWPRPALGLLVASVAVLAAPAAAQNDVRPGFELADVQPTIFALAYGTLASGEYVGFDGSTIARYAHDGTLLQTYSVLPSFVFPSFVEIHPSGTYAVIGESSNGVLYRLDLGPGTVTPIATQPYLFDFAWDVQDGFAYVSAGVATFDANDVYALEIATGALTHVVHVGGPSGPIEVDSAGDLYYATQVLAFPPPVGSSNLITWTDAQLASGTVLTELDSSLFSASFNGLTSILHDPSTGDFFVADGNSLGFENLVHHLDGNGTRLGVVAGDFSWITNVELEHGSGPAVFAPFQPAGARLRYTNTNFGLQETDMIAVDPRRAEITFHGPPQGQAGQASVQVAGALPSSSVVVYLGRAVDFQNPELTLDLGWGVPAFSALALDSILRRTSALATDANGEAQITYFQSASLGGQMAFQAIVLDANAAPLGTSTALINN